MKARGLLPALLLVLANFCSFALVEWKLCSRPKIHGKKSMSMRVNHIFLKSDSSSDQQYTRKSNSEFRRTSNRKNNEKQLNTSKEAISSSKALKTIETLQAPNKINRWLNQMCTENQPSVRPFYGWSTRDQIAFVKLLQGKKAFDGIMSFLDLGKPDVKVFTTAAFAVALSGYQHRRKALEILKKMDECHVEPTALTIIALLGALDGPSSVSQMMNKMEERGIAMNTEVFNSAIYAIRRMPRGSKPDDMDWQVALNLFQKMRSKRIPASSKTYNALLQVLSRTGKVRLAMSLLQQWKSSTNCSANDDHVWAAAINVCAQAADYERAIQLVAEMQAAGYAPTLRHCSALLKAFARAGRDDLALATLQMMLGDRDFGELEKPSFSLPCTSPDLIALNTVIKSCAKADNLEGVMSIFERMQAGEFRDPESSIEISPDLITFHSILQACHDPEMARDIVKEMRLSRRNRYGVVPPTNVTYALAINVCQKAETLDLELVECFLRWAQDDDIQPSVFMYASAIWAAQRAGSCSKALAYFDEMESLGCQPNSVAFDGAISALFGNGEIERAITMYERTRDVGHEVSPSTMKRIATAIHSIDLLDTKEEYLNRIVAKMSADGLTVRSSGPIFESLISLYGSQGRFDDALLTFDIITGQIDGPCLRAILLACSMASPSRWMEAITILHISDVTESASGPGRVDQVALGNALIACSKADEFEEGLNLLHLYGVPDDGRSKSLSPLPIVAINSLIAACGRGNRPDLALALLNEMRSTFGILPDERSYRSTVMACNRAEHKSRIVRSGPLNGDESDTELMDSPVEWWECGLALFRRMREENITPDAKTYSSVISACEAAGEWQRALGVLEIMIETTNLGSSSSSLNLYCFNCAISACEKGGAWVEALEIYERMIDIGGPVSPNFVTLSSLVLAFDKAGQKELAQSKFEEGVKKRIVQPWRWTRNKAGESIYALDLHNFSSAMAKAAIRSCMDSYLFRKRNRIIKEDGEKDLVIITGKGLNTVSNDGPVLHGTTLKLLESEYGLHGAVTDDNEGRVVLAVDILKDFVGSRS